MSRDELVESPVHGALQSSLLQRLLAECGDVATSEVELRQVLAVLAVLAAENDTATLTGVAGGLALGVLTDVVIANLEHLPLPEELFPGGVLPPQIAPSGGMTALAGLMQVLSCLLSIPRQGCRARPLLVPGCPGRR